jgi:DNA-directed RNA polymerase subunit RPC12/RpoP
MNKIPVSVSCPHCSNPVIFKLSPRTLGGSTEPCRKCSKLVVIKYHTDSEGSINEIRTL